MDYKEFLLDELTNKLEIGLNGKLLSKEEIEEKK